MRPRHSSTDRLLRENKYEMNLEGISLLMNFSTQSKLWMQQENYATIRWNAHSGHISEEWIMVETFATVKTCIQILQRVRVQVPTAVAIKNSILWDVMCGSFKNRCFGGTHRLHNWGEISVT
jgi:hypothetical protein